MCGIAGYLDARGQDSRTMLNIVGRMADAIYHRGPDASGVWSDPMAGIALGHRRLSILDLSTDGSQPMISSCGRYVMVFNGEVYNFRDLRKELEAAGATFRGHSDTEVMLAAFTRVGIKRALDRFAGMFAFAVWDREERKLILARDRMGEKPLYYGLAGKTLLFASELKAMKAHPSWEGEIDRNALASYMRFNCVPGPQSIFRGIRKLPPGTFVQLTAGADGGLPEPEEYWSVRGALVAGRDRPFLGDDRDAIGQFDGLLKRTISEQMVSDVPLGAFLSGGVDSSAIVAMMQAQSAKPINTFTIGFKEKGYDEAVFAKEVSRHLGTSHTELYVDPRQVLDVIPMLPGIYDEPFADSSQIPTYLVAQMTRRHVTVSLSGDGGDELLGGYSRYFMGRSLHRFFGAVPNFLRKSIGSMILGIPPARWDAVFATLDPLMPARAKQSNMSDKLLKFGEVLSVGTSGEMYPCLMSHWKRPEELVLGSREPSVLLKRSQDWPECDDYVQLMSYLDMMTYLPDDILVKVDRAAMAGSLETRAPFLDHRLVEFAWTLPARMKIREGRGKWLLRQVLYKYVPQNLIDRPKKGFGVPIASWLRGPLREWASSLLEPERLRREGFLNADLVQKKWKEHLTESRNWHYYLWDVLMFQAWLEAQTRSTVGEPVATGAVAHALI